MSNAVKITNLGNDRVDAFMLTLDARQSFARLNRQAPDRYISSEEPNFVEALAEAVGRWSDDIGMGLIVPPKEAYLHPVEFIQDWIWGPKGEFTGFARINLMADITSGARYHGSTSSDIPYRVSRLADVSFVLNFYRVRESRIFDRLGYGPGSGKDEATYLRFASYMDYVLWEHYAADDCHILNHGNLNYGR